MSDIRVLVADDEPYLLELLAQVIRAGEGVELVATAGDAASAVDLAKKSMPDVAVLDVNMPGGGGAWAAREIRLVSPATRVVALSGTEDRAAVLEMLVAGATGYVVKGARSGEILDAVRQAARGEASLSSAVAAGVIDELTGRLEQEAGEARTRARSRDRVADVIAGQRLSIVVQPIFDLVRGRIAGAEALSRFPDAESRGPHLWFAEAVAVGLGVELEHLAVRTALEDLAFLPEGTYLSVNLSPEAVCAAEFIDVLAGAPMDRIVVEITEHAAVADYEVLAAALGPFRSRGGRVAVDDAGAGFASLRHIVRLDPDIIKLDISLTRNVHSDRTRRALAAALISFASETGTVIVAEGVETDAELATLRSLGVREAQGFHLARPLSPRDLASVRNLVSSGSHGPAERETA